MSDDDSEAAMREMMGFSGFGRQKPKAKAPTQSTTPFATGANASLLPASLPPRPPRSPQPQDNNPHPHQQATSVPLPPSANPSQSQLHPASTTHVTGIFLPFTTSAASTSTPIPTQATDQAIPGLNQTPTLPPQPPMSTTQPTFSSTDIRSTDHLPAYRNPASNYTLSATELDRLSRGRRNERGDVVFFKPSFVDPDPWARLKGSRTGRKEW